MPSSSDAGEERPREKLHRIRFPRMRFSPGAKSWWVAAYITVTLVCTAGWLFLGQRLAEQTGLRRQVWLANDFQGAPVISDVARCGNARLSGRRPAAAT